MDCKKAQASFWGDGNILCLHYSDGFMDVDSCQNSSHCNLHKCNLLSYKVKKNYGWKQRLSKDRL